METGKTILEKEKRVSKSKDLRIIFTTAIPPVPSVLYFKVLDENMQAKYTGKISINGPFDTCSCPSFYFGMKYARPTEQTVIYKKIVLLIKEIEDEKN